MKITLKEILFIVAITGISLSLSSYGTPKKALTLKSAIDDSWKQLTDTTPTKKLHTSSYTASDSSHQHTGNKKAIGHSKKKPAKNSDAN